jgi:hypothetical protein
MEPSGTVQTLERLTCIQTLLKKKSDAKEIKAIKIIELHQYYE